MKTKPTQLIGVVAGHWLYEHPEFGDEVPMLVKLDGAWVETEFYELPDVEDFLGWLNYWRQFQSKNGE